MTRIVMLAPHVSPFALYLSIAGALVMSMASPRLRDRRLAGCALAFVGAGIVAHVYSVICQFLPWSLECLLGF